MICIITDGYPTVNFLLNNVKVESKETYGLLDNYLCSINKKQFVIVAPCYFGKVACGTAFGILSTKYKISAIIVGGQCGAFNSKLDLLKSIAITDKSLQFDVDYTAIGFPLNVLPELTCGVYHCNEQLIQHAKDACAKSCVKYTLGKTITSDQFIADTSLAYTLSRKYCADFTDVESGNFGLNAFVNNIPYVSVKGISNYANDDAGEMYDMYSEISAMISYDIIYNMLVAML